MFYDIQDFVKCCIKHLLHLDLRPDNIFGRLQPTESWLYTNYCFNKKKRKKYNSSLFITDYGSLLVHNQVTFYWNFSFQPVLHDWCNKGCGMYYPVRGMMHIKEPLLLIGKSSLCGGSRFPLSRYLSGPLPYVRRHITVNKMC